MVLQEIRSATSRIFEKKKYLHIFLLVSFLSLIVYIALPVFTIPGNNLLFWLEIMPWWGYIVLFFFSFSLGMLITMQLYLNRQRHTPSETGKGIANLAAVLVSGFYSTAACAACITTVFAFLGSGGVFFINTHRLEFTVLSVLFILVSLYFTSKRINDNCEDCKVPATKKNISVN